jgi:hypothetical protein
LIALLAVVGGIAIVASLAAAGVVTLPFMQKSALAGDKSSDHKGQIPIPIAARSVAVFNALQPGDLFDPQTHTVKISWVEPEMAKKMGFITQYPELLGRVLNHDKSPGYAFTEADFYPYRSWYDASLAGSRRPPTPSSRTCAGSTSTRTRSTGSLL